MNVGASTPVEGVGAVGEPTKSRGGRVVLAVSLLSLLTPLRAGTPQSHPKLTVHVYNYAKVPAHRLAGAEGGAKRTFQKAGIDSEWLDSQVFENERPQITFCEHFLGPSHVIVNILPHSAAATFEYRENAYGVALTSQGTGYESCAYIFYGRIQDLAKRSGVDDTTLLAHMLAHEVGHLLLGSNSHTPTGLMRDKWRMTDLQRAARGSLAFTLRESELMRDAVLARSREGNNSSGATHESRR